jgi:hypothetical protein
VKIDLTNPAAVTATLTAGAGTVVGIIAAVHPGFREPVQTETVIAAVGFLVAGAAAIAKVWHHTKLATATITAPLAVTKVVSKVEADVPAVEAVVAKAETLATAAPIPPSARGAVLAAEAAIAKAEEAIKAATAAVPDVAGKDIK